MTQYTIGNVEKITGIKSYVLRYWEEMIPFISPKKDLGGRRIYSQRDLDIILRIKYLLYEKKFTIEGAQKQLVEEMNLREENSQILMQIHELREELQKVYLLILGDKND